ncbi:MAG: hypothetical protein ABIO45_04095 [Burkholderiaceae bacterium]
MSSPFQPRLPSADFRSRNPPPFVRGDAIPPWVRPAPKNPADAARDSTQAPVRDLLASLGF